MEKYQKKWLSLNESYLLSTKLDIEIDENRKIYWKGVVKWSTNTEWINLVSVKEFDNMTPIQQNDYSTKLESKYWKIKFK
jgi:hypothetical protein